jgi:hypothetical protein
VNKIERVRAALAGRPVDRAPFTVWYHFGTQHAPAERTAQVHLEFFDHYDLDLLTPTASASTSTASPTIPPTPSRGRIGTAGP